MCSPIIGSKSFSLLDRPLLDCSARPGVHLCGSVCPSQEILLPQGMEEFAISCERIRLHQVRALFALIDTWRRELVRAVSGIVFDLRLVSRWRIRLLTTCSGGICPRAHRPPRQSPDLSVRHHGRRTMAEHRPAEV